MDLSVKLVLRAQAEGTSAIRAMREETQGLSAAMKEVRAAARAGGSVSPASIEALGGFDGFQKAFLSAQKEIAAAVKTVAPADEERRFQGQIRRLNTMAKVRSAEEQRMELESRRQARETESLRRNIWLDEVRAAKAATGEIDMAVERSEAKQRQAALETLQYNMRMWAQRGKAAEKAEAEEVAQRNRTLRSLGLGMFAGPGGSKEEGHGHGRSLMSEFKTAAGYTLTYGAVNKALQGVGAVARSPFALGRMTLGIADQAREIREASAAYGLSTRDYQDIRYAFASKGMKEDKLDPMMRFMEHSAVAAIGHTKAQAAAFQTLGISMRELRADSNNPVALLYRVSDALGHVRNDFKRVELARRVFGRNGAEFLPLFEGAGLRGLTRQAEASHNTLSDSDLAAGQKVASQYSQLKLQLAGIRNETAAAAFPIMSELLGDTSSWLKSHRKDISYIINTSMAELKKDLPYIINGMDRLGNSVLALGRDFAPFLHNVIAFSQTPIAKFIFSGQVVPGVANKDLSIPGWLKRAEPGWDRLSGHDPKAPVDQDKLVKLLNSGHGGPGIGPFQPWQPTGHVAVTVTALPGAAVTSIRSTGNVRATAHRGVVQPGG